MEKQKINEKEINNKVLVLVLALIFGIVFFINLSNAKPVNCFDLTDSECKANYKCVFDSESFLIFAKGKCIDAREHYLSEVEEDKLDFIDGSFGKSVSGFFVKVYGKITGNAPGNLLEAYEGEEADFGNYKKETFYVNAGSKLLAKIVQE
mgnify:CR=1 FL=1